MEFQGLSFEVVWFDEDVLEVEIKAAFGDFAGAARVYCPHGTFRDIASLVQGFPTGRGDKREVSMGSFAPAFAGGGASIELECESNAGHSYATVYLETDKREATQSLRVRIPVEAAAIDAFVVDLRQLDDRRSGVVTLTARGTGVEPGGL